MAKGIGNGYPLGAIITTPGMWELYVVYKPMQEYHEIFSLDETAKFNSANHDYEAMALNYNTMILQCIGINADSKNVQRSLSGVSGHNLTWPGKNFTSVVEKYVAVQTYYFKHKSHKILIVAPIFNCLTLECG